MPIPTPSSGEPQNKFISRCISFLADEDPSMPNDQRVAICFNTWRRSKGEMTELHPDFTDILNKFVGQYERGAELFGIWLNKHELDPDKPYQNKDQLYEHACSTGMCESFRWIDKPLMQFFKADEEATFWKVVALTANVSQNNNDYGADMDEFRNTASSLSHRPLNWNHDHTQMLPFPEARTELARFEDNAVETLIRIPNDLMHPQKPVLVNDMIRNGDILHVSIEGTPRGITKTEKGVAPNHWNFTGLALLEKDVTLPGDPLSSIEPLLFNESMGRSLVESLMDDGSEQIDMTQIENKTEETTLAILAEEYTGVGGIDQCSQCINFKDLKNSTIEVTDVGEQDSSVITRTSGGFGAGVGICEVATQLEGVTKYVRKNDPVCTDGRPRPNPTDADRIKEEITLDEIEKIAIIAERDRRLADKDVHILEEINKTNVEREAKLTALKQISERDITLKDKQREIATLTSNNTRLTEDVHTLRKDMDVLREEISGLKVGMAAKDADIKHYKDRYDAYERTYRELSNSEITLKERLTDAVSKRDEALEKTATYRQQTINAANDKARIQEEYAQVMEQLSNATRENSDSAQVRASQAKKELRDTQEIIKIRKQVEDLIEELRDVKQKLNKANKPPTKYIVKERK